VARLSRRDFLKAGGATLAALATSRVARAGAQSGGRVNVEYDETASFNELFGNPPLLGRVEAWWLPIVSEPVYPGERIGRVMYDEVVPIWGAVHGDRPSYYHHNDLWYDIGDAYVHSSYVVPCHEEFHQPEAIIGDGFWGEITVPTSWQHWQPRLDNPRYYDLAYGSVYRVIDRADEPDGRAWYRLLDDANPSSTWWAQARHVRRIRTAEFSPISYQVEDKRIEVDLRAQTLACLENGVSVFQTRIATGTSFTDPEGNLLSFHTPPGDWYVYAKMPSRRMYGGESINDIYDLPGVPWVTYFTPDGAAIHGTYWHNDYGRPRSHGCINVTSDAAKWVYRWTRPWASYSVAYQRTRRYQCEIATPVIVV
jgi:hypothetical protein